MKINIRAYLSEACKQFREQIRGWNGRGAQINNMFFGTGKILQKIIADMEDTDRTVIKLISLCGDGQLFCCPYDQLYLQLIFQRPDMCADGRLGQIEAARGLRKASVIHHCGKSFQLFKIHVCPSCFSRLR